MKSNIYLKKNSDFLKVYGKKNIMGNRQLTLYLRRNKLGYTRAGFSLNKKVGNAVTRNRVKRRLREIYKLSYDKLKPGFDMVIVAKPTTAEVDFKTLRSSYYHVIRKANWKWIN